MYRGNVDVLEQFPVMMPPTFTVSMTRDRATKPQVCQACMVRENDWRAYDSLPLHASKLGTLQLSLYGSFQQDRIDPALTQIWPANGA